MSTLNKLNTLYDALKGLPRQLKHQKAVGRKPLRSEALRAIDLDKFAEQYHSGLSIRQLASRHGIDRGTVRRLLGKANVETRRPGSSGRTHGRDGKGRFTAAR